MNVHVYMHVHAYVQDCVCICYEGNSVIHNIRHCITMMETYIPDSDIVGNNLMQVSHVLMQCCITISLWKKWNRSSHQ